MSPSVSLGRSGPSGAVRSAHLPVKEKAAGSNPVWGAPPAVPLSPLTSGVESRDCRNNRVSQAQDESVLGVTGIFPVPFEDSAGEPYPRMDIHLLNLLKGPDRVRK
jgi:hypothetical protein